MPLKAPATAPKASSAKISQEREKSPPTEHEISEHDGENPRRQTFEPAFFAAECKETAEEDGERFDALIDGLNDGLGEGREFENEREDEHGRKAEEDREQDGLGDLHQMSGKRIFRLHDKKDTSA